MANEKLCNLGLGLCVCDFFVLFGCGFFLVVGGGGFVFSSYICNKMCIWQFTFFSIYINTYTELHIQRETQS